VAVYFDMERIAVVEETVARNGWGVLAGSRVIHGRSMMEGVGRAEISRNDGETLSLDVIRAVPVGP
jgi:hypothetical protein